MNLKCFPSNFVLEQKKVASIARVAQINIPASNIRKFSIKEEVKKSDSYKTREIENPKYTKSPKA